MSENQSEDNSTLEPIKLDLGNGYQANVTINTVSDIIEDDDGSGNINVDHNYDIVDSEGNNVEQHLTEQQLEDIETHVGQAIEYFVVSAIENQLRESGEDSEVLTENQKIDKIADDNGDYYWGIVEDNNSSE
ncbi:hypothetical protein PBI_SCTP2_123 [Salicola phage SCTP-2]|nr:hypothetical protein PBI_SCTP2_123 [Salicola phage SCTP-2]